MKHDVITVTESVSLNSVMFLWSGWNRYCIVPLTLRQRFQDWLNQRGIDALSYSDYMAYDQLFMLRLSTFLTEVIEEAEHLLFTACDSHDGDEYLVYMPSYPWNLRENERDLTEERIREILSRYVSILSDKPLTIAYRSIENGS